MAFNDPFQNSLPDYFYFDHKLTKGLCDFNIGKSGVVSFIYNIPTIGSKTGFESKILGGCVGVATATVRHESAVILRRIGLMPELKAQPAVR